MSPSPGAAHWLQERPFVAARERAGTGACPYEDGRFTNRPRGVSGV
ncbi:MAG: hypothetical protein HY804_00205 [Nitrospinae bacterium]|nr:hypothetical protein [Nitrospinota bacterium]